MTNGVRPRLQDFYRPCETLPEIGRLIEWISPGGSHVFGTYQGGVVWLPEGSNVYVYYTPEFWRYVD